MKQTISIFGCGWVGKALAQHLQPKHIKASVQSLESFETLQIQDKYLLNKDNNYFHKDFYNSDVLIIAIPPRGEYLETLKQVLHYTAKKTQIILLSSSSVYPQTQGTVKEADTQNIKEPSLMLEAELLVKKIREDVLILRLAGLMGYNRISGKYTAGKRVKYNAPVNLIHRDDVTEIIHQLIEKQIKNEIFNLVAPEHPSKKELYQHNAKKFGFEATTFENDENKGKIVSSQKLIDYLDYKFIYPNPLSFLH